MICSIWSMHLCRNVLDISSSSCVMAITRQSEATNSSFVLSTSRPVGTRQVHNGSYKTVKFIIVIRKQFLIKNDFWAKKSKNALIMHNLCLIILATNTIFIDLLCITLPKLHAKLQSYPLEIFWVKVKNPSKNA